MTEAARKYPEQIKIAPLDRPVQAEVRVPGSKSITNRALVLAALAGHGQDCFLRRPLRSEDTEVMLAALQALGFDVQADWEAETVRVGYPASAPVIPAEQAELFLGNSGTSMRFLTAMVCLGHGRYRLDGVARMRERPIGDLLGALRQLGAQAISEPNNGCPPVVVQADGLRGGAVRIKGDLSSQFLSGLLMAVPLADGDVTVEVTGPMVSEPYVAMTVALIRAFGGRVETSDARHFLIPGRQRYTPRWFEVEPDASAASYFFAAAAITRGQVFIPLLTPNSLQGDLAFVDVLGRMGCRVERLSSGTLVRGAPLRGIDVDMNAISDTVMTLAAVALFAEGPTTIRNVAHIRHKETDRLAALATELRKLGADVEEFSDGLTITPRPLHGAALDTYRDHRMAMSLALVGLRVPGIVIRDPGCVYKTYPNYWEDFAQLSRSQDGCDDFKSAR